MARRSDGSGRFLARPVTLATGPRWAGLIGSLLLLTGCIRSDPPPPTPPAPTLEVVIATQGPPPVPTPGVQQTYEVREGDTLSAIAARFGVEEDRILKQNPDLDADTLYVGQELVIPAAQP
ncbi:MAG: LysM domain-containing protein [Thermomicrobiales bacterium]